MKKRIIVVFLKTIVFILSFFFIFFLFSCSRVFYTYEKPTKTDELKNKFKYYYYQGVKNKILNNFSNATDYFHKCLEIDKNVPSVYYELGQLAYINNDLNKAKEFVLKAQSLDKSNVWYANFLINIYEELGDINGAKKILKKLLNEDPNNLNYLLELAGIYEIERKFSDAILMYNKVEEQMGITDEITERKLNLLLKMNKFKDAEKELKKIIKKYPDRVSYYTSLARIYMNVNEYDKSCKEINKALRIDSQNGRIYLQLAECFQAMYKIDSAFWALANAFELNNVDIRKKVEIIYNYMIYFEKDSDNFNKIDTLVNILLKKYPEDVKSYTLAADFYSQKKKFKEAKKNLLKAKKLDRSNYLIWQQLMYIDNYYGNYDTLIVHGREAIGLFPFNSRFYLYTALGYFNKTMYDSAIFFLRQGLDLLVDSNQYKDYYYFLAESYHKVGKDDSSFYFYEKLLEVKPNYIVAMNNYSYYLAIKGENLDKADSLMKIVLKYFPVNPSYLDTYGWVLYKKGDYESAKIYLAKAIANGGDKSPVINEHYADVLYKMGDIKKAVKYWKYAYSNFKSERDKKRVLDKIKKLSE